MRHAVHPLSLVLDALVPKALAQVFVCYSRQTGAAARTLADDIEALGHDVWLDHQLSGGQAWWDEILLRIRDAEVFVIALAPEALDSVACRREYRYAEALGKPILPVLVAEGVSIDLLPPALSKIQFVDYRVQDRAAGLRLARAISTLPPPTPLPEPLPPPPELPVSYLGSLREQIEATTHLDSAKQSELFLDLKRSLRDSKTAEGGHTLLKKLRKRGDLLATIAEEIDALLSKTTEASSPPGLAPELRPGSLEPEPEHETTAIRSMPAHRASPAEMKPHAEAEVPGPSAKREERDRQPRLSMVKAPLLALLRLLLLVLRIPLLGKLIEGVKILLLFLLRALLHVVRPAWVTCAFAILIPLLAFSFGGAIIIDNARTVDEGLPFAAVVWAIGIIVTALFAWILLKRTRLERWRLLVDRCLLLLANVGTTGELLESAASKIVGRK